MRALLTLSTTCLLALLSTTALADEAAAPPPLPAPPTTNAVSPTPPAPPQAPGDVPQVPILRAPGADDGELARLRQTLTFLSEGPSTFRWVGGAVGLFLGAVNIPLGIVMLSRTGATQSPGTSIGGGLVLGTGIGGVLGAVLNFAIVSDPHEKLYNAFEARAATNMPSAQNIAMTEGEWRSQAKQAGNLRTVAGALSIGLGVVASGMGAYFVLGKPGSLSRGDSDAIGGVGLAFGGLSIIAGTQILFMKSPIEASWESYRGGKGIAQSGISTPRVGLAPLPGGGLFSLHSSF